LTYTISEMYDELWTCATLKQVREWMREAELEYVQDELGDDDDEDEVVERARDWINSLIVLKQEKVNWRLDPDAKLEDYI
jgi:hypothetical protein